MYYILWQSSDESLFSCPPPPLLAIIPSYVCSRVGYSIRHYIHGRMEEERNVIPNADKLLLSNRPHCVCPEIHLLDLVAT